MTPDQLVVGQRYRVLFEDCAAQGSSVGRFVAIRYDAGIPVALVFDNGEIGPDGWGEWLIEPVEDGDA